jgi:hypothetical protein
MAGFDLRFTDLHIQLLARALVPPGEHLTARAAGTHRPWWAFGLLTKTFVVLATDHRVWVAEHRFTPFTGCTLSSVYQLPIGNVTNLKVKGLIGKKLAIAGQAETILVGDQGLGTPGPFKCTMKLATGIFPALRNSVQHARQLEASWKGARSLGPAQYPAFAR